MHRPTVGIIAFALLAAGGIMLAWPTASDQTWQYAGTFLRIGAVMAVLWLALPQASQGGSLWTVLGFLVAALLVALRPKLIFVALAILIAFALLRPRIKSRIERRH